MICSVPIENPKPYAERFCQSQTPLALSGYPMLCYRAKVVSPAECQIGEYVLGRTDLSLSPNDQR